jgi:hypothetical protein
MWVIKITILMTSQAGNSGTDYSSVLNCYESIHLDCGFQSPMQHVNKDGQ